MNRSLQIATFFAALFLPSLIVAGERLKDLSKLKVGEALEIRLITRDGEGQSEGGVYFWRSADGWYYHPPIEIMLRKPPRKMTENQVTLVSTYLKSLEAHSQDAETSLTIEFHYHESVPPKDQETSVSIRWFPKPDLKMFFNSLPESKKNALSPFDLPTFIDDEKANKQPTASKR